MRKPDYLKRLRTLSIFLQRIDLIERINDHHVDYHCAYTENGTEYFEWIIYQLPHLFRQGWQFNDRAGANLVKYPNLNPILSFRDFFGLDNSTAAAIIMPGHSYYDYRMAAMDKQVGLGRISEQINRYIIAREMELIKQNVKFKSVL